MCVCVYERDGQRMEGGDWWYFPAVLTSVGCGHASVWGAGCITYFSGIIIAIGVCKHHFGVNGRSMDLSGAVPMLLITGVGVDLGNCVHIYSGKQDAPEQCI